MFNKIVYNKNTDFNITLDEFKMTDTNGKIINTPIWYLHNNVKINLDVFPLIIEAGVAAQRVLYYILITLKHNTNIVSINRKDALKFLGSKDPALITNGLKVLKKLGLIVPINEHSKNDYYVPLNNIVRGNVNVMIAKLEEEEKERQFCDNERLSVASYKELIEKHKLKINKMQVKIKKLSKDAVIPTYAHATDAGLDLTAVSFEHKVDIDSYVYGTGLAIEIPEGYVGLLFPRSSNRKTEAYLPNSVGVIDSGFRGEIMVSFKNRNCTGTCIPEFIKPYNIGDRIAQLIIIPYPHIDLIESDELSKTDRDTGGHGSTGK